MSTGTGMHVRNIHIIVVVKSMMKHIRMKSIHMNEVFSSPV